MMVGLTGGIACGKSTVGTILRGLGATVVDADEIARDVVAPGAPALARIKEAFGAGVMDGLGSLDRTAMAAVVLNDREAKKRLEAITHPAIRLEIADRIETARKQGARVVFVEAALLVETGSYTLYPHLWVVRCDRVQQIKRLMKRKRCPRIEAEQWIDAQMPTAEKEAHATRVIDNTGSMADLKLEVAAAHAELMGQLQGPD